MKRLRSEATHSRGQCSKHRRMRTILNVYAGSLKKPPKKRRRFQRSLLKKTGPISKRCSGSSGPAIAANISSVADDALLWIVAALNYFVDPFDLIPDEVPFLGFVDDAAVLEFAVEKTKSTLDDFMIWETSGDHERWVARAGARPSTARDSRAGGGNSFRYSAPRAPSITR